MSNTVCITSVYKDFWGTDEFYKSANRVGMPVYNAWKDKKGTFSGHNNTLRYIYETLVDLKEKYKYAIYADGADSYFLKSFTPPDGKILYSTEKAYYPEYPNRNYKHRYTDKKSEWCYLNNGGWCGEIKLLIEYFEKTGLHEYNSVINGQHEAHKAFFEALDMGFPMKLDQDCRIFQSIAFDSGEDFKVVILDDNSPVIINIQTESEPCLFHGNGRTDMKWIYDLYK